MNAPAIFPNNDIKFEVSKKRARIYAAVTHQAITWSKAQDSASSTVTAMHCSSAMLVEWMKRSGVTGCVLNAKSASHIISSAKHKLDIHFDVKAKPFKQNTKSVTSASHEMRH